MNYGLEILFWGSVGLMVSIYVGYPVLLWVVSPFLRRRIEKKDIEPMVSILISAHNEEKSLEGTIRNKLDLDYPNSKLEIIVVSDGSEDNTESIVQSFSGRGVRLLVQKPRAGKTLALNKAAKEAKGEILVFSDANSLYDGAALRKLVRNFSDPNVGYVTGKMVYVDSQGSLIGSGCSAYMRYENNLRALETKLGSVIGVDGGIDAVRKDLFEDMEAEMLPDFVLPLRVIAKRFRVIYESEGYLKESTLSAESDEWRMRVRVALRSFHALWSMKKLLNPFKYPFVSFQIFFHKILRYAVGLFQIVALISNALLVGVAPAYVILLVGQSVFYAGALLGLVVPGRLKSNFFIRTTLYFCLLNAAALLAFLKFLRGEKQVIWIPRKG